MRTLQSSNRRENRPGETGVGKQCFARGAQGARVRRVRPGLRLPAVPGGGELKGRGRLWPSPRLSQRSPAPGPARQRDRRHGGHRSATFCARRGPQRQRLQGEQFQRRRRAGLTPRQSLPLQPAPVLCFLSRPPPSPVQLRTAGGVGWGSPGTRVPRPERIPEASALSPQGNTEAGWGQCGSLGSESR